MKRLGIGVVLFVALAGLPLQGLASTLYVSTTGNDLLGNGSLASPFRTITNAVRNAFDGDTIRVLPGTYDECVFARPELTGEDLAVTIVADDFLARGDNTTTVIDGTGLCDFPDAVVNISGQHASAPARLEGFTVTGGTSSGVFAQGSVTITNNVIRGNSAPLGGGIYFYNAGCIYGDAVAEISGNEISGNAATWDHGVGFGGDGGGIYVLSRAGSPSTFCIDADSLVRIDSNTIVDNAAVPAPLEVGMGGGIWAFGTTAHPSNSSSIVITGNTIAGNSSGAGDHGYGGGVWVASFGIATGYGVGIDSITVSGNAIVGNTSAADGGGVSAWILAEDHGHHTLTLEDNDVSFNVAQGDGGGLDLFLEANDLPGEPTSWVRLRAAGNRVAANTAGGRNLGGGGISASMITRRTAAPADVRFELTGNTVTHNRSGLAGGGLSLWPAADGDPDSGGVIAPSTATILIENTLLAGNEVDAGGPGGAAFVFCESYGPATAGTVWSFDTIADNSAGSGAGGIEIEAFAEYDAFEATQGTNAVLVNSSIVAGNDGFGLGGPADGVPGVVTWGGARNLTADVRYSNVHGHPSGNYEATLFAVDPTWTDGNVALDPRFADAGQEYRLGDGSPAIDAGDPVIATPAHDFEDDPRVYDGDEDGTPVADMGWDEVADGDGDDVLDHVDNCRLEANAAQTDTDGDGAGDACDGDDDQDGLDDGVDNCPTVVNERQEDFDDDGSGDACDPDDGILVATFPGLDRLEWQVEDGFVAWNVYRGDLAVLRGTGVYTQEPDSNPLAARWCALASAHFEDAQPIPAGAAAFYLVTGVRGDGTEGLAGTDSAGTPRPIDEPCPGGAP